MSWWLVSLDLSQVSSLKSQLLSSSPSSSSSSSFSAFIRISHPIRKEKRRGMELYSRMMEEITFHTGLSPTAFFTIAALMVVVYRTVCGMFVAPEDFNKPPTITASATNINISNNTFGNLNFNDSTNEKPVHLGDVTEQQLRAYDGSDPNKPILMAIKGQIYDVSTSKYVPLSLISLNFFFS